MRNLAVRLMLVFASLGYGHTAHPETPACQKAISTGTICEAANTRSAEAMASRRVDAVIVMQEVQTGHLLVSRTSDPQAISSTTKVLPLSFMKVLMVASWWDNELPNELFQIAGQADEANPALRREVDAHDILAGGSDSAGKQMAVALRQAVGEQVVLRDLKRYKVLSPSQAVTLAASSGSREADEDSLAAFHDLDDGQWADVLSVGETHVETTVLNMSYFLQAVGNNGVGCAPEESASKLPEPPSPCRNPRQVVKPATAMRLQSAFRSAVQHGTATHIAHSLDGTGWAIGGKTGTGGRKGAPLDKQDGCFAGLLFDPTGKARFTVVTYVRAAGIGGGVAAEIAAQVGRFLINPPR